MRQRTESEVEADPPTWGSRSNPNSRVCVVTPFNRNECSRPFRFIPILLDAIHFQRLTHHEHHPIDFTPGAGHGVSCWPSGCFLVAYLCLGRDRDLGDYRITRRLLLGFEIRPHVGRVADAEVHEIRSLAETPPTFGRTHKRHGTRSRPLVPPDGDSPLFTNEPQLVSCGRTHS